MMVKEFRELRRDRRTMAMLIVLPLLLLVVFGYAANFKVSSIPTDVYGAHAQQVAGRLVAPFHARTVDPNAGRQAAETALRDNKADVVIVTQSGEAPVALIDGSSCSPRSRRCRRSTGSAARFTSRCSTTRS
ncbi:MAG TPA: hypothetical protein VE127_03545 [Solirubrobacteraceae bacterium]|nr:hypothetical protein [Solirubrobacteraceae bacterium]